MEAKTSQKTTSVSIIIVTRNTWALTSAAVRSVFDGKDDFTKEVIVVDNGSTDETSSALPRTFPAIKYIRSEANLGFAGANNLGARQASGEFILLLNSDARLQLDSLRFAVDWMRERPECGVAGAQLLNPDGSRQNSIANFPSLATELLNKSLLRRLFPKKYPGKEQQFQEPMEVESLIGAFMLIRESVWRAIGGLDERYFFFFEETDFCWQVRQRNWKIFHLPQVKVWHEQGTSASQVIVPARVEYWRSRYAYFAKNDKPLTRTLLRAGLSVRLLGNYFYSAMVHLLVRSQRSRSTWQVNSALLQWHLRSCPPEPRLPR